MKNKLNVKKMSEVYLISHQDIDFVTAEIYNDNSITLTTQNESSNFVFQNSDAKTINAIGEIFIKIASLKLKKGK